MTDKFEDILKKKLEDYSLEPFKKDWEIIERRMGLSAKKKKFEYFKFVAAAIIIGILLSGILFILRNNDITELIFYDQSIVGANEENSLLRSLMEIYADIDLPQKEKDRLNANGLFFDNTAINFYPADIEEIGNEDINDSIRRIVDNLPNGRNNPFIPQVRQSVKKSKYTNWSLGLFADGNIGGNGNTGNISGNYLLATRSAITAVNMANNSIPKVENFNYNHKMPLSAGLMVRRSLNEKWGVETGLTYTLLVSKASSGSNIDYTKKQSAHYIGVPVAVTYTIVRKKNLEFYSHAGIEMNFNVRTHIKHDFNHSLYVAPFTENYNANNVQWSAAANIGLMYNINPVLGIYFEPGYSHFFTNDKQPETYWQEHPDNFNMRIGFRTNF